MDVSEYPSILSSVIKVSRFFVVQHALEVMGERNSGEGEGPTRYLSQIG